MAQVFAPPSRKRRKPTGAKRKGLTFGSSKGIREGFGKKAPPKRRPSIGRSLIDSTKRILGRTKTGRDFLNRARRGAAARRRAGSGQQRQGGGFRVGSGTGLSAGAINRRSNVPTGTARAQNTGGGFDVGSLRRQAEQRQNALNRRNRGFVLRNRRR